MGIPLRYTETPAPPVDWTAPRRGMRVVQGPKDAPRHRKARPGMIRCDGCGDVWDRPEAFKRVGNHYYCHHCGDGAELQYRRALEALRGRSWAILLWGAALGAILTDLILARGGLP